MVVGEVANFAAYAFAPAMVVTPLGGLSIIVSAVLADKVLGEKLHSFGWLGCALCLVGSVVIVLHSPEEKPVSSVIELWIMAMQPYFLIYVFTAVTVALWLIFKVGPHHGSNNMLVYVGICSLFGSLSVMSCKALGISIKLTVAGSNQFLFKETWFCAFVVAGCIVLQMNYLNRALDIFNTAVVTPVYYVTFTTLTITASVILFKEWEAQTANDMFTVVCGFLTIMAGVYLLHVSRDPETFRKRFFVSESPSNTQSSRRAPNGQLGDV